MPNLNIKGSVLDDFGRYLPTPIIDKVIVNNESLEVNISLYFNFTEMDIEQGDIDDYIAALTTNKLYVYVAYILGEGYLTKMLEHSNVQVFGELYNGGAMFIATGTALHDLNPNYQQVLFDTWTFEGSSEKYYNDNDERIVQYVATVELPIGFFASTDTTLEPNLVPSHNIGIQTEGLKDNIFQAGTQLIGSLADLSICAFTSWIDLDTPTTVTNPPMILNTSVHEGLAGATTADRKFDRYEPDLMPRLAQQQVSNISYESVFKDRLLNTEPQLSYVDGNGATYNKTPIQAIDGKLYKQEAYSLEQIVALFTSYVSDIVADDDEVQDMLDNISYIVQTYGDSSQLLLELNILRKAFPDKSTATPVGRLYNGFKGRFFGANEKVASGTSVVEQLYKSSKLVDARITPEGAIGTQKEDQNPLIWNFIYPYQTGAPANWGTVGAPDTWREGSWMTAVTVFTEDTSADIGEAKQKEFIKAGFWFFDYRLALRQYSQACSVLSYNALQQFVGGDQLNRYFVLDSATVKKWRLDKDKASPDSPDWPDSIENYIPLATFKTNISTTSLDPGTGDLREAPYSANCETVDVAGTRSDLTPGKSWLQMRGIAGTDFGDSNKLLGFQFQDVEAKYDGNENYAADTEDEQVIYSFSVSLTDTTSQVLLQLYNTLNNYFETEFKEYYEMAVENCSYNSIDGTFNDFFTEGIMAHYGTDTTSYPWYRMPVLINLHKQMLVGEFGDDTKLIENAEQIASNINPINGNLSSLEAFKYNCETFIANYYGEGSTIWNLINTTPTVTITIGEDPDNLIMARPPAPIATIDSTWEFTDTSQDTGPYGRTWGSLNTADFDDASFIQVNTSQGGGSTTYYASEQATLINDAVNDFFSRGWMDEISPMGGNISGDGLGLFWPGSTNSYWVNQGYEDPSPFIQGHEVTFEFDNETVVVNSGGDVNNPIPPTFDSFVDVIFLHLFGHAWDTGAGNDLAYIWLRAMSEMFTDGNYTGDFNYLADFALANDYDDWISSTSVGDIVITPFTINPENTQPPFNSPVGMKWLLGLSQTEELYLRLEQLWIDLGGRQWGCVETSTGPGSTTTCAYATVTTDNLYDIDTEATLDSTEGTTTQGP